ncbi:IclR family transcriptional regulator [Glaciihabitans tibetensis]|uniref:IclR family transcriptional regulator n=1 Tax=Glaciihabitans tibetensis TaxID=1266600 RepID=A0A2T0VG46_9MICO|nr:IclR family transcriptional regulator [Glaciihabitans tibetensis]PRY69175.1 IclR family transcriptional regulator [Glaciihabitans tibetensis]
MSEPTPAVTIIERMTAVLGAFSATHPRMGVNEIARRAGLPKSTTSRLVSSLVRHGYLAREGHQVCVGLKLFELGKRAGQPNELRSLALPTMADLRSATMQTVHLSVLEGTDVVYIGILPGRDSSALLSRVGGRLPAYATGAGKALLAFSEPAVVERVIERGFVAYQPGTITNSRALLRELESIRRTGLAYSTAEAGPGVAGAASPILTFDSRAVAALSVSGRIGRFDPQRVGPAVHMAALHLGRLSAMSALSRGQ